MAALVNTTLRLDFDPTIIPTGLRDTFIHRNDGICLGCGLYQDFLRFSLPEMRAFAEFNKDETVSEVALRSYPPPADYVEIFDAKYVTQRVQRWRDYFLSRGLAPRRSLFIRPMFGGTVGFAIREWQSEVCAVEISRVCRQTVESRIAGARFIDIQVHGLIDESIEKYGQFDAIFLFHTLVHCVDIHRELALLARLLNSNGVLILSQEIQMKPANPFHMIFATEPQLTMLLGRHFRDVQRIDDCDPTPPAFIADFTIKHDSPDFAAMR